MVINNSVVAVCLVGTVLAPPIVSSACLLVMGLAFGLGSPALYATAQTMAGPTAAGR
jgi:hypothetical protein